MTELRLACRHRTCSIVTPSGRAMPILAVIMRKAERTGLRSGGNQLLPGYPQVPLREMRAVSLLSGSRVVVYRTGGAGGELSPTGRRRWPSLLIGFLGVWRVDVIFLTNTTVETFS